MPQCVKLFYLFLGKGKLIQEDKIFASRNFLLTQIQGTGYKV